jgi:uncharacterized protein Smg (DUF494 family)
MQDVLDLLTFIAESVGRGDGIEGIRSVLKEKGYSENEINLAFNYFLLTSGARQRATGASKARVLHPVENVFVSPEAYGHLLKLRALKIIDDSQMEKIIDMALTDTDHPVDVDQMKRAAYKVLFRVEETDEPPSSTDNDEESLPIH